MHPAMTIKRALISVSDKKNLIPFAATLHNLGVEILSTGGTAKHLKDNNIPVTDVAEITQFPEIMNGRVKTLHPNIHAGLLGRRDVDQQVMQEHNIKSIDLLVVNLYPFEETIQKQDVTLPQAIEQIDIGGPAMIRAAAKNHQWCTVITEPDDYMLISDALSTTGEIPYATRLHLAKKAFSHTARYDGIISNYLTSLDDKLEPTPFSETLNSQYQLKEVLRYGENPHQQAALYHQQGHAVLFNKQYQGKSLSYNNLLDTQAAVSLIKQLDSCACVIVKHNNPCGVALADNPLQAYERAFQSDPQSAFGGIIAFNRPIDEAVMNNILTQQFAEVILAPGFTPHALEAATNKPNCRLLSFEQDKDSHLQSDWQLKTLDGGLLMQSDPFCTAPDFEVVGTHPVNEAVMRDCQFAWQVCKTVKSNAIVLAKNGQTIGIGAGQTSRIFSLEIACLRAKQNNFDTQNAIMASDAFLPFKDNVELAHAAGIKAIIQTGGSKRDEEVISSANELGIAMIFTHRRYFMH